MIRLRTSCMLMQWIWNVSKSCKEDICWPPNRWIMGKFKFLSSAHGPLWVAGEEKVEGAAHSAAGTSGAGGHYCIHPTDPGLWQYDWKFCTKSWTGSGLALTGSREALSPETCWTKQKVFLHGDGNPPKMLLIYVSGLWCCSCRRLVSGRS